MFKTHQAIISKHARRSPQNFAKVLQFVILTVQEPLYRVPNNIKTAAKGGEDAMGVLFGFKFQAYNNAEQIAETALSYCEHVNAQDIPEKAKAKAMVECIASEYGFGLVKAGFVIQLAYGYAGCLDTHNIKRYGLKPTAFKNYKALKTAKGRARKLDAYINLVYKLGGPEGLWDSWCQYVADNQPQYYRDANHVSQIHVDAIVK